MRRLLGSLAALLVLAAQNSYGATGSTGYFHIDIIRAGGGFLKVVGATAFTDPSSCGGTSTSSALLILDTTPSYKEIVAFVLSAKMAGKKVSFWVSGCANEGANSYPNALYAYIQD